MPKRDDKAVILNGQIWEETFLGPEVWAFVVKWGFPIARYDDTQGEDDDGRRGAWVVEKWVVGR